MVLTYAKASMPSALAIAREDRSIMAIRQEQGDINWGREYADTLLNSDISNATNKRVMRELFERHGVPMPRLVELFPGGVLELDTDWLPLVGRPDKHTKGRGFWLCRNSLEVSKALRGTAKKQPATHFMEYIDSYDHEYRVHIFKGKSIRISEKKLIAMEGNHKIYTTIKPTGYIKHVRKAAKQAIEALELDFGAVDILATDNECWVLEVNCAPGLGGTMPRLYAQTFTNWLNNRESL